MNERTYKRLWLIWWSLLIGSCLSVGIGLLFPEPMMTLMWLAGMILMMVWLFFGFLYQNRMVDEWVSRGYADPEDGGATVDANASMNRSPRE